MTETLIRLALRDSAIEVLEKMFFVEMLRESADAATAVELPADVTAAGLTFQGEISGSFLLRLTTAAARQIAADFLGVDEPQVSGAQTSEVVRELANMICGSVLSRVESAASFRLAEPRIVRSWEEVAGSPSYTHYAAKLSNGRLMVSLGTGTALCPQPAPSVY